jgi:hypothetical protein
MGLVMETTLERAGTLKEALLDFVLEADGDLATSLETYCAEHLSRFTKSQYQERDKTDLVVDSFLTAGRIGDKTPLQLFIEHSPELEDVDRILIKSWQRSFTGLFSVTQVLADGFELMNWMTAKHYIVKFMGLRSPEQFARLKEGEIILTRIAPVTAMDWMFFSALILLGKLGKPKLAVAIGNFKKHFQEDLYGDAPELLEEAWHSVEQYHQEFIDFFGKNEIALPGYQANQQLKAFQEVIANRRLDAAGINSAQSLKDLVDQAGALSTEVIEAAESKGASAATTEKVLKNSAQDRSNPVMAAPQVDLADRLKQAKTLTIITHPRWGQMILPTYHQLKALLETDDWQSIENAKILIVESLKDPEINTYIWKDLAHQYPLKLEAILKTVLGKSHFTLDQDFDKLLQEFGKPLNPILPETANVPFHLHTLFQDAVKEVHKSESKSKSQQKVATGFQKK